MKFKKIIGLGLACLLLTNIINHNKKEIELEKQKVEEQKVEEQCGVEKSKTNMIEYDIEGEKIKFEIWTEQKWHTWNDDKIYDDQILFIKNLSDNYISVCFSYSNEEEGMASYEINKFKLYSLKNDKNDKKFLGNGCLRACESNTLAPNEIGIMGDSTIDGSSDDYDSYEDKYSSKYYAFKSPNDGAICLFDIYGGRSLDGGLTVKNYHLDSISIGVYNKNKSENNVRYLGDGYIIVK